MSRTSVRTPPSSRTRRSQEWVIQPRQSGLLKLVKDLWQYRDLFGFIAARAVLQIYRRARLGMAWLVIRPVVTVAASIFVVGRVLGISTEPVPLVLFTILSLSLWTLLNRGLRHGTRAITRGRFLIRRVSFPRLMLVVGSLAPTFIEFAVVFVGAIGVLGYLAYTGAFAPMTSWRVFSIIPILVMMVAIVIAVSCVTGVLNNIASDTALSVNYATSVLFVVTPVMYPLSVVPGKWQWAVLVNPLAPMMEIWRSAFLGTPLPPGWAITLAVASTIGLLVGGLTFFSRWEQTILDKS